MLLLKFVLSKHSNTGNANTITQKRRIVPQVPNNHNELVLAWWKTSKDLTMVIQRRAVMEYRNKIFELLNSLPEGIFYLNR